MTRHLLIFAIAAAAGSCASGSNGAASRAACALESGDSVYLVRGPVYRDCAVDERAAVIDRSGHPNFSPSSPPPGGRACYTAEVEFVVDTQGIPEMETVKLVRTNNPDYAQAAVPVVAGWRYKPAILHGVPVRQIVHESETMAVAVVAAPAGETPRPPTRAPLC
ncbi:MAG TPA: hypothetical protein VGH98_19240 [Gemmatimonadaceae bacterium]|jgi:hypothetical protein